MNSRSRDNEKLNKLMQDLQEEIEIPDSAPSWNALQSRLKRRTQRKRFYQRTKIIAGFVCASLLISVLVANNNTRVYANMSLFLKKIQNNIIEIFLKEPVIESQDALTLPPPQLESVLLDSVHAQPEKVTLNEAQEKLAFPLLLPSTVTYQLKLNSVQIFQEADEQYRSAYLEYTDNYGSIIKVNERLVADNSGIKSEIHQGSGTFKEVAINESFGILMLLPDDMISLEWITPLNVKVSISGTLGEDNALRFAKSFQNIEHKN